jgi:hypothetical protein
MGLDALKKVAKWYTTCCICEKFVPFACGNHLVYHCDHCCAVVTRENTIYRHREGEPDNLEDLGMSTDDFLRGDQLKRW